MPDERDQQDPPWGRPEDEETVEQPNAEAAEEAYHDGPDAEGLEPEQDFGGARVTAEPAQGDEEAEEYKWHTGRKREHGATDAVEFIDVVKAFGRNTVLNGLNLGLPEGQISMILGPSGT